MTTTHRADILALSDHAGSGVVSTKQLRSAGVSARRTARLSGPGGPWRRLHPGVFLLHNTAPTRRQMLHAAIARFGDDVVITGTDALRAHGINYRLTNEIQLLVSTQRRLTAPGIVTHRTARLPDPVLLDGLPFAPASRAALDLARQEPDPGKMAYLLTLPLHWGLCDKADLMAELDAGNQRGSAAVRAALRGISEQEAFAQGWAAMVLDVAPLPPPSWNVTVCDLRGRRIGTADAWWDEVGLAWRYRAGTAQPDDGFSHLALTATGIVLVRCTLRQLQERSREVAAELVRGFAQAARTPRPKVRTFRRIENAA
ncbi:hypothetical protein [Amycolatopsis samaneae]|uniref:Transcriptional regulator, AbiEi antitoxin, Type IV TA system n=1 Tax=Amycolatopsis samaneae TaxID=664691 RepID=A0ABW5GMM0_9PSEU